MQAFSDDLERMSWARDGMPKVLEMRSLMKWVALTSNFLHVRVIFFLETP